MSTSSSQTAPLYTSSQVTTLLEAAYTDHAIIAFGKWPDRLTGYITFFDPGLSILQLCKAVTGRRPIFHPQDWYDNEAFAKVESQPCYRQLRMEAVPESFNKSFAEQQALVPPDEEIPLARVVCMGMVLHFLATGVRLFPKSLIRCIDETSDGDRVFVGNFVSGGFHVHYWDDLRYDELGLVTSRKV